MSPYALRASRRHCSTPPSTHPREHSKPALPHTLKVDARRVACIKHKCCDASSSARPPTTSSCSHGPHLYAAPLAPAPASRHHTAPTPESLATPATATATTIRAHSPGGPRPLHLCVCLSRSPSTLPSYRRLPDCAPLRRWSPVSFCGLTPSPPRLSPPFSKSTTPPQT